MKVYMNLLESLLPVKQNRRTIHAIYMKSAAVKF